MLRLQDPFWLDVIMSPTCGYPEELPIFVVRAQPGSTSGAKLTPSLKMLLLQHVAMKASASQEMGQCF